MAKDIVSFFLEKGEPLPKPKPRYTESLKVLETPAAKNMIYPESLQYMKNILQDKAYQNKEITTSDYYEMIKPQSMEPKLVDGRIEFGEGGDYWSMVTRMFVEAGSEKGTGMNINDFAAMYFPRDNKSDGGRIGFKGGNYNPSGKNQYTANMRTDAEIQKIIDSKPKNWTKKDFRGEGKLNKEKILTRKETDRPGLKFYFSGKRKFLDTRGEQNLKTSKFYKSAQGSAITMDKINNFAHYAPKLLSYLTSTADTGPLQSSVNRAAEGYDKKALEIAKEQERLLKEKPKGWKYLLTQQNYLAAQASKEASKKLPSSLKGTLGYFVVNPDTGKFTLKGVDKAKTFAGISGEPTVYKTAMTTPERKEFGKKQSVIQGLINKIPGLTRASNAPIPPKTLTANMFKNAFKGRGAPGPGGDIKDPLGGPDLIDVKKFNKNPYDDDL